MLVVNGTLCLSFDLLVHTSSCYALPSMIISCSFGVGLLFGFPLHCFVLCRSAVEMTRGQSSEIFVFNLALVEIFFYASYTSVIAVWLVRSSNLEFLMLLLALVVWVGRPLFLSCLCLESYVGVVHPRLFVKLRPMRYRTACCVAGWLVIFGGCLSFALRAVGLFPLLTLAFLVFFCVKLFTCLMVLRALKAPGPSRLNRQKLKAFRIISFLLSTAVLAYSPQLLSILMFYTVHTAGFLLSWAVAVCVAIMAGFVQPALYVFGNCWVRRVNART